jgi:hypothetical protein
MRLRFWINTIFLIAFACSRETPAPPPIKTPPAPAKPVVKSITPARAPVAAGGSYTEAMLWLRSAPAFAFIIDENGLHAEGDLTRKTVGAESVRIRANGEEWRATANPRGVAWERRNGNAWKAAPAPAYGNRIYQRVTLAFDPQKKEGGTQFVGVEETANHYRFTNANTGELHDVWVNVVDNHIERMKIGQTFELRIEN